MDALDIKTNSLEELLQLFTKRSVAAKNLRRLQAAVAEDVQGEHLDVLGLVYWALATATGQLNRSMTQNLSVTLRSFGYRGTREVWLACAADLPGTMKRLQEAGLAAGTADEVSVNETQLGDMELFSDWLVREEVPFVEPCTAASTFSRYSAWPST